MSRLFPDRGRRGDEGQRGAARAPDDRAAAVLLPGPVVGPASPAGPDLPLVVMARMSLSFPGLISAVPLYAVDHGGDRSVVRHLFSDGGISSNFPMHFFDSLLPSRPTFGVNLAPPHPHHPEKTWRPDFDAGDQPAGAGHRRRRRPSPARCATRCRTGRTTGRSPSGATPIGSCRSGSDGNEGGMNLRMPEEIVLRLVARGAEAGDKLLDVRLGHPPTGPLPHRARSAHGRAGTARPRVRRGEVRAPAQPRARHRRRRRHATSRAGPGG